MEDELAEDAETDHEVYPATTKGQHWSRRLASMELAAIEIAEKAEGSSVRDAKKCLGLGRFFVCVPGHLSWKRMPQE